MSQKINPTSTKLGILQLWNCHIPMYGKSFNCYRNQLQLRKYIYVQLSNFFKESNILLNQINMNYTNHQILINVSLFSVQFTIKFLDKPQLLNNINYWFKVPITLNLYKTSFLSSSSFLLNNYVIYLTKEKNLTPKKILRQVYLLLKQSSKSNKLIYTTSGLKKASLKGFKLQFSGCFESSRSQMAKTIKCSFGSVPLTSLKGYVEYSSNPIFTKFGACGLKVWLFYELKSL
uniref:Ribosomal protein S3 n=1 Tax=Calliarthron tuberculosum TaxID=48942 RepID=A0A0F7EX76_CALTB|nr:ribosomal protein S3 [Calliarthron tuberculosum]AKG26256.1 ribosomal protein S3 [Calliarthron tuberculosum]